MAMYTAWYLCEMFDENTFINQLLKDKVFYIAPTINPDSRNILQILVSLPGQVLCPTTMTVTANSMRTAMMI